MNENVRCESSLNKNDKFFECKKINYKKLGYNKKLSGKFRLYLSDNMAYKRAFDLLIKKSYIHH